jgi:hypothetical protein
MTPKVLWESVKKAADAARIDKLAPQTCDAHVAASVIWPAANSTRSSSSSDMCPFRRPNITSAASRTFASQSMTGSGSNRDAKGRITRPFPTRQDLSCSASRFRIAH